MPSLSFVERVFTLEEATALLPRLTELLAQLQQAQSGDEAAAQQRHQAASNGSSPASPGGSEEFGRLLAEISDLGIVLRDPATGLVDFPAEREGDPVYLCWRLGEPAIAYWHPQDTGIAGRRPL